MLPKEHRFSFKKGLPNKAKSFPSFTLRYGKNREGGLKTAVVVSKKVHKKAVIRNKIKRKLLRMLSDKIDKSRAVNLVFYIKRRALDIANLEDEVEQVLDLIEEI
ncbi:MAG: hypothetical protein A3C30_03570 [Candidatus Levybacteria bacterium RIFCSPHIGHO2_02_FULL_40_18]|nr:MAG: hypothetical protein A2869_00145 [Candidatus Levybacteria bacterium RIFCSPHIGHO2_01_FULL_40_58]OGH26164.1 MAG: hypothetical protein A3C30_03570 [Candidatus Levybacteria bacterium RIFCSPHIGHO2_02_FULL_40_18]OGH31382.1 MAG: hypothetical protein A3E43_03350 [Candidatus Levybacteria bacterium RIFCSPHIGHO2_12_FULL_40_31]OGH40047.1 MAG: hypothetical protein A2894_03885 [Candidatus Levybacteria bacterium RIFCSPLOWO2_01_FULL_40_64]OGH49011.1 MAG: hypothetical protein A3I54_00350 [Candidatus Lev